MNSIKLCTRNIIKIENGLVPMYFHVKELAQYSDNSLTKITDSPATVSLEIDADSRYTEDQVKNLIEALKQTLPLFELERENKLPLYSKEFNISIDELQKGSSSFDLVLSPNILSPEK